MAEKTAEQTAERIYVVPLTAAKRGRSSVMAPRAVNEVRQFLIKHMKVEKKDVWIDDSINRELWSHGKYWTPSKIRIRAVKFDDGVVEATLPELAEKKSRRELLKEEREKKTPILRKEEAGEEAGVPGAEDYDITPGADGEVKIKKKKAPKEKEEEPTAAPEPAEPKKPAAPETPAAQEPEEEKPAAKKPAAKKQKAEAAEKPAQKPKKAAAKKPAKKKE